MYCSNCGNQVPDDTKTCPECGQDLSFENERIGRQPHIRKKKTGSLLPMLFVLAIGVVAVAVFYLLLPKPEQASAVTAPSQAEVPGGVTDLLAQPSEEAEASGNDLETIQTLLAADEPTPTPTVTPIANLPEIPSTAVATPTPEPTPEPTPTATPTPTPTATPTPTETPAPTPAPSGDYVLPGSDTAPLDEARLSQMDAATIRLARNEIYARHGLIFKSADLRQYFEGKSWYHGSVSSTTEIALSDTERANIAVITAYEKAHNMNQ